MNLIGSQNKLQSKEKLDGLLKTIDYDQFTELQESQASC